MKGNRTILFFKKKWKISFFFYKNAFFYIKRDYKKHRPILPTILKKCRATLGQAKLIPRIHLEKSYVELGGGYLSLIFKSCNAGISVRK